MLTGPLPDKVNFSRFVDTGSLIEGTIPVRRFTRLCKLIESCTGQIEIRLEFIRDEKQQVSAAGTAAALVQLVCQSCLENMDCPIAADIEVVLLNHEDELATLPYGEDGVVVDAPMVSLSELVEDELILALPMVPRHADCSTGHESSDEHDRQTTMYRPFADLSKLIKD